MVWSFAEKPTSELIHGKWKVRGEKGVLLFMKARTCIASCCVAPVTYCDSVKVKESPSLSTAATQPLMLMTAGFLLNSITSSVVIGIGFNCGTKSQICRGLYKHRHASEMSPINLN